MDVWESSTALSTSRFQIWMSGFPSFTLKMALVIPGRGKKRWCSIDKKIYKCFTRAAFPAGTVEHLGVYLDCISFSLDLHRNIRWNFCPCFKSLDVISLVLLCSKIPSELCEFSLVQEEGGVNVNVVYSSKGLTQCLDILSVLVKYPNVYMSISLNCSSMGVFIDVPLLLHLLLLCLISIAWQWREMPSPRLSIPWGSTRWSLGIQNVSKALQSFQKSWENSKCFLFLFLGDNCRNIVRNL